LRALPYLAFFLSGASSLIFQALWTRMLHHVFGATSVAMSSVLTAFMAGLGLGAHLFGRRVKQFQNPLRVYAVCELLVALCALILPELVTSEGPLASLNGSLRAQLGESSFAFMLARFFCVLPLLLVPTTLMGGTLPLLSQHFVEARGSAHDQNVPSTGADERATAKVGALYAVNTFGAVAGSLLGSFVLMPAFGVQVTNWVAVSINAGLALFIFALARTPAGARELPAPDSASEPARPAARQLRLIRLAAAIGFACSGACAMAYEVVWSRALSMAIGSSLQAFALILVTFLVGIALGSAILSSFLGQRVKARLLVLGSAALSCSVLALTPTWVLSSAAVAASVWALTSLLIVARVSGSLRELSTLSALEPDLLREAEPRLLRGVALLLVLPMLLAVVEAARFLWLSEGAFAVSQHGYLPYITGAVVACICAFMWIAHGLSHAPLHLACAVQLFVAAATLVTCIFQDEIPYTFARLVSSLKDLPSHVGTVRFFMFFSASLCTLPATLGMGAMFPITLSLWSGGRKDVGKDVGSVYAANTLGSLSGAWLPGFVLLPLLGMQRTLDAGIALNALVACAMFAVARVTKESVRGQVGLGAACVGFSVFALTNLFLPDPPLRWNLSHMTLGAFRVSLAKDLLDVSSWGKSDLVYYRDGVSTTVSVERWGRHLSLKNNGKVDASNGDDMPTQIMVAAYPLLLHPRGARDLDVAVVGFGSGVTVGATLSFPVKHVEAMELERAVVEAAVDFFSDVSRLPKKLPDFPYVDEPRLTLHNDDGRNFLASTSAKYDAIISEPSNPWITGVSDLFTIEHFRITKKRLKPGGVYCQWVQLYEMSPTSIKTIYRTFASQFRYVMAFAAEELSSDTILVGSDSPLPLSVTHVERALADARVSAELERAYVHSAYDVWSRMLFASREEILRFAQHESRKNERGELEEVLRATGSEPCQAPGCVRVPAQLNSDDNMLIELRAPSDLIGFSRYQGYLSLFYSADWPYGRIWGRMRGVDSDLARARFSLSLLAQGRKQHARPYVAALPAQTEVEARGSEREQNSEIENARLTALHLLSLLPEPALQLEPATPGPYLAPEARQRFEAAVTRATGLSDKGEHVAALRMLQGPDVPELLRHLSGPDFHFRYGLALYRAAEGDRAQLKRAAAELEDLIRKDELYARVHPELYYFLAKAQDSAASFDKAVRNMRAYVALLARERVPFESPLARPRARFDASVSEVDHGRPSANENAQRE
jgi:spermidine synthase